MGDRTFRAPRMDKSWNQLLPIELDLTANFTFLGAALEPGTTATVLRMIGEYVIGATGGETLVLKDSVIIVMAIGIVSSDAFALGTTAVPDPGAEPDHILTNHTKHRRCRTGL